jgi:hypothetical protein
MGLDSLELGVTGGEGVGHSPISKDASGGNGMGETAPGSGYKE